MTTCAAKDELSQAILSVYDLKADTDAIIAKHYAEDAEFEDPMTRVKGRSDVQAQFRSLPSFLAESESELYSTSYDESKRELTMDTKFHWKLSTIGQPSVDMKIKIVAELNEQGQILKHTDHWVVKDKSVLTSIEKVPGLKQVSSALRWGFGSASTKLIDYSNPGDEDSKQGKTEPDTLPGDKLAN